MAENKIKVAQRLADAHFSVEPNLQKVFLLSPEDDSRDGDPIMLLEVVEGSFAEDIFTVGFPPDLVHDVPYRSAIVEIPPAKLGAVQVSGVKLRGRKWEIEQELRHTEIGL